MCLPLHHSALFLKPATTSRRPQVRFTLETCLPNNHKYDLMNVENRHHDEAIKISPKQKTLKTL